MGKSRHMVWGQISFIFDLLDLGRQAAEIHSFLSIISVANPSVLDVPVSFFRVSTNVVRGRPLLRCPCVGSYSLTF